MFITYKISTRNAEIREAGNIEDYVVGLWFQQKGPDVTKAFHPIPCAEADGLQS